MKLDKRLEDIIWREVLKGNRKACFDYFGLLLDTTDNSFCDCFETAKLSAKLRNFLIESINPKIAEDKENISKDQNSRNNQSNLNNLNNPNFDKTEHGFKTHEYEDIIEDMLAKEPLIKSTLLFESRINFDSYCQYIEYEREKEKQFYYPRRKVLGKTAHDMNRLINGDLELLAISVPPGTGKSTLGIFLLSWVMGKNPDAPNLVSAHSGALTRSFFEGVLKIITDPEYLWKDVFPAALRTITNAKEETIDINETHRFSTLTCRAINASLTGATRCEGLLYADDLCSGIEEALSRERMESLWTKYTNDLKSRKKMGAKELHIATRWTVHDVIGKLENEYAGEPKAKFISLPAFGEDGESNFNYDFGVGFDKSYFLDMKKQLDEASFAALYMNEPFERDGLLFRDDELRKYFELPEGDPDSIISICDCKDTGGDYLFLPIAYILGEDYYIEDCVCNNGDLGILEGAIVSILNKHGVKACRFESNASGSRFAEKVQGMIKSTGGITHVTTKHSGNTHKETRIITDAPWVREHCLFKENARAGTDYFRMMKFLCSWTQMGRNKYDDVVDGMSQLARFAQSLAGSVVRIFSRPF
jgi:predicted phage terminase large subunit-like protein